MLKVILKRELHQKFKEKKAKRTNCEIIVLKLQIKRLERQRKMKVKSHAFHKKLKRMKGSEG